MCVCVWGGGAQFGTLRLEIQVIFHIAMDATLMWFVYHVFIRMPDESNVFVVVFVNDILGFLAVT